MKFWFWFKNPIVDLFHSRVHWFILRGHKSWILKEEFNDPENAAPMPTIGELNADEKYGHRVMVTSNRFIKSNDWPIVDLYMVFHPKKY